MHISREINILNKQKQLQSPHWRMQLFSTGVPEMLNGEILRTGVPEMLNEEILRPGGSEHWQVVKEKKGDWKPMRPEMAVLRKRFPRGEGSSWKKGEVFLGGLVIKEKKKSKQWK